MNGEIYDFPMTIDEATFIHDCLIEQKNTFYIGIKEKFTVQQKEMLANLIDNLGTWIDNRSVE